MDSQNVKQLPASMPPLPKTMPPLPGLIAASKVTAQPVVSAKEETNGQQHAICAKGELKSGNSSSTPS